MRFKKPYIASLDQVTIKREAEYAVIDYVEPEVSSVHLKIGPEIHEMTDEEILLLLCQPCSKLLSLNDICLIQPHSKLLYSRDLQVK